MEVMANLLLGTLTPPKHGHLNGLQTMFEGILKEFRLTAFSTASRWYHLVEFLEYLQQVLALTFIVEHFELGEQPFL